MLARQIAGVSYIKLDPQNLPLRINKRPNFIAEPVDEAI